MSNKSNTSGISSKSNKSIAETSASNTSLSSDDFLNYVSNLGLGIPGDLQKGQHLDYALKDPDTARILRLIMDKITPSNVCDEEELAKYEKLESRGKVLHGKKLEEALDVLQKAKKDDAQKSGLFLEEEKELDAKIEAEKAAILRLQIRRKCLSEAIPKQMKDNENCKESYEIKRQNLEKLIGIERKKLEEMITAVNTHVKSKFVHKSKLEESFKSYLNWDQILERERGILKELEGCFAQQGLDESGPLFKQYQDMDIAISRVIQSICYEEAIQARHGIEQVGIDAQNKKLPSIVKNIEQLSEKDKGKFLLDLKNENKQIEIQLGEYKKAYLNKLKEVTGVALHRKIRDMGNAIDYNGEFLQTALNLVKIQYARLDLMHGFLVKEEREVAEMLEAARIFQNNFYIDLPHPETQAKTNKGIDNSEKDFQIKYAALKKEDEKLRDLFEAVSKSLSTKSPEELAIERMEKDNEKIESENDYFRKNYKSIIEKSVKNKKSLVDLMRGATENCIVEPTPVFAPAEEKYPD